MSPGPEPTQLGPTAARLGELDVLRGLAAAAVMLFHYTVRYGQIYGFPFPPLVRIGYGFFGVELFFCISGFVIFMTLDRTRRPMDFVVSRVARLWPAFIVAVLGTHLLVRCIGLPGREVTDAQALLNLTMIPELLHVPFVDGVYWSLQVELIFYAWMLLAFRCGLLKHVRLLLWAGLAPAAVYAAARIGLHRALPSLGATLLLVDYVPFFVIGMTAYRVRVQGCVRPADAAILVAACTLATISQSPAHGAVALLGCLLFCAVALDRLRWLARGPLVFLGTISYTLYLLHQNVGYIVIRSAAPKVGTQLALALAICVAIASAALLTTLVERPARDWLRARYRQMRRGSGLAAGAVIG